MLVDVILVQSQHGSGGPTTGGSAALNADADVNRPAEPPGSCLCTRSLPCVVGVYVAMHIRWVTPFGLTIALTRTRRVSNT